MALKETREAIAEALATIPGLAAHPKTPPQLHPPAAIVEFDRAEYHLTADMTSVVWFFRVMVLVSLNDVTAAQEAVEAYISPDGDASIRAALEDDPTLDGVVSDTTVRAARDAQEYEAAGETFWGVRIDVEVIA